jgi:glycosyltransferase involved in cell wall biosynthesis
MVTRSARRRLLLTVYPPDGGAAQHVVDLALGLDADLWAIDLACLAGSEVWAKLESRSNVTLHELRGSHGRPGLGDLGNLTHLARLAGSADVIHGHSSKAGFLTRLAALMKGRRGQTLFTPHGWSFWAAGGAESRAYLALERAAAHWCRFLVTVSNAERQAGLARRVGRREQYRVILNGIALERYAAEPHPLPGRILFVGRLRSPKRVDLAVRALALVRRTLPEATLDVVGDGPLRDELGELAAREGVTESIGWLGTRSDVPELLAGAACLLLASDYEGCPLTVLEAMAAGLPVVATAVGGVPELVAEGETGLLVPPGRPEPIASALEAILGSPDRARAFGAAGRERARLLFSRERMVSEIGALYDELLAHATGTAVPPPLG